MSSSASRPASSRQRPSPDRFTTRARPTFLYVMYTMLLFSLPVGALSAVEPTMARALTDGVRAYLSALPDPLYALFAGGYLGYATLRQWGKLRGTER